LEQIGEVVELRGKKALVRIRRVSSCGENCSSCSGSCTPTASVVSAVNGLSAKVGDTVKLSMNASSFLFLAFLGYIFPLIVCVGVYFIVNKITGSVMISDIFAVLSLILTLFVFYLLDKLPDKPSRFSSRIIKILR